MADRRLVLLTTFVLAGCLMVAQAYKYECLTNDTPETSIGQYEIIKMKRPLDNCDWNFGFCDFAVMLSTDRYDKSSTIYLLTAFTHSCLASKNNIIRAFENQDTEVTFHKIGTNCRNLSSTHINNWRRNRYIFNGLTQCIDSLCLPDHLLGHWHVFQHEMCREYLAENPPSRT